nr:MAG TPA: tail assembly chaperone protein [Caudoviricetes sp.]
MIKYNYKGNQYDWLGDIRKVIWNEDRMVFGEWDEETKKHFGVTEVNIPEPEVPPYVPTDEELADRIRRERDEKLEETDFFVMPDYPSDPKDLEEVKTYRQALRDITKQSSFPKEVTWPELPSVFKKDTDGIGLKLAKASSLAKVGI